MKFRFVRCALIWAVLLLFTSAYDTVGQCAGPSIPRDLRFEEADDYRKADALAADCIQWLLSPEALQCEMKRKELDAFVMVWISGHPDITVNVDPKLLPYLKTYPELLFPSIYAMTADIMSGNGSEDPYNQHAVAVEAILDQYGRLKPYRKNSHMKVLKKKRRKGELKAYLRNLN